MRTHTTFARTLAIALTTLAVGACNDATTPVAPVMPSPSLAKSGPNALPANGRIYFTSDVAGPVEVYSMNADGSDRRRLTYTSDHEGGLDVSRDGKRLAVAAQAAGSPLGGLIYTMNVDGTNRRPVISVATGFVRYPAWSPDARTIAYSAVSESDANVTAIWTVAASGGKATQLPLVTHSATWPAWSPDGARIVYIGVNPIGSGSDLYTMNADGSAPQLLYDCELVCLSPAWSPDGYRIYYVTFSGGVAHVEYCALKTLGPTPVCGLSLGTGVSTSMLDLSPDGSQMVFMSQSVENNETTQRLATANVNGSAQTFVTGNLNSIYGMAWGR